MDRPYDAFAFHGSPSSSPRSGSHRDLREDQESRVERKVMFRSQVRQLHLEREKQKAKTDGQPDTSLEGPAVTWTATIFDAADDFTRGSVRPRIVFKDDQPLTLTPNTATDPHTAASEKGLETTTFPAWKGCVFDVSFRAKCEFPNDLERGLSSETIVPESLKLFSSSRLTLTIRSPFLYKRLSEMVGYYPSFQGGSPKEGLASHEPISENTPINWGIYEPFAALMHCFPDIKDFVLNSTRSNSSEVRAVIDKAEGPDSSQADRLRAQVGVEGALRLEREHVRRLYEFLKPRYQAQVVPAQDHLKKSQPLIAFDMLWYLFRPGTDVYIWDKGSAYVCVVDYVRSDIDEREENHQARLSDKGESRVAFWILDLWYLDTDGARVARSRRQDYIIPAYTGYQKVTMLPVCPTAMWDAFDNGEQRQAIMRRSKLHLKALQQGHLQVHYDGPVNRQRQYAGTMVIDPRRGLLQMKDDPPRFIQIRDYTQHYKDYDSIIVNTDQRLNDPITHAELDFEPSLSDHSTSDSHKAVVGRGPIMNRFFNEEGPLGDLTQVSKATMPMKKDLSDHQLLLLCPLTRAFALKTKQWVTIAVDYARETTPSELSLANLVLGSDELETVRGLSKRQNSKHDIWAADFIEGKGTGQIILLHGPPGVGKTYTVEAIAEWLHRPLLALTIADIGTIETRVELELIRWFTLAEAWNAVLLVDEADIFLEKRQNRDLARNGLVSAFLRRMEYFEGLLFLTTNRVGQIDDAFISRVHIAIGYKALDGEDRKRIWNGFFQKLLKERAGKIQIAPGAKKWVLEMAASGKAQLNGRDIRNALQTAITLAEAEAEEDPDFDPSKMAIVVDQSHFQRVLDISHRFHEYVQSIRREDEQTRANRRQDRNDLWYNET
ncbi:MAG: hypothetical protein Q9201_006975, partial [Fulgogasparrea decipioides]